MEIYEQFNDLRVAVQLGGIAYKLHCEISSFAKNLYYETCRDFGIISPYNLKVFFHKGSADNITNIILGRCRTLSGLKVAEIYIHAGFLKYLPDSAIHETIPHEVAHAIVDQIFPDIEQGHGKEWAEMMEYFKLPANEFYKITPDMARTIVNFGEL